MKPAYYLHITSVRMTALFITSLIICAIPGSGWGQANPKPSATEFTRGTVDGCGINYTLSYSPLVFQMSSQNTQPSCSVNAVGDADGDGFWDQAEAELLWAFAPWIEFDEEENFIEGMVFVYQATPDRTWWSDRGFHLMKIKLLFLFRGDANHTGDSEGVTLKLVSSDVDARTWRIYDVTGYNAGHIDVREDELSTFCVDPGMVATPYLDLEAFYCGSRGEEFFYDPMVHIGASNSLVDSGMIHPKIFISDGKHGLYPKIWQCNEQIHDFKYEDCGLDNEENQRGIMIPAIPLVFSEERLYGDNADIYSWTQPLSEYLQTGNVSGLNSLIGQGNLGEIGRYLIPQHPWFLNENVQNKCFCGGHRPDCHSDMLYIENSCSNCGSADGTGDGYSCGAGISRKMSTAQLPYKSTTCFLVDSDQDGVSDEFDCEPFNPQLKGDWDRDGLCDEPVEDETLCLAECDHFKIFNKSKCEFRCKTVDPCVFQDPGIYNCRTLQESVLPYRKLSELNSQEKLQFNNCQKMYGNTLFHHRRMNGAYEYVVANHLCGNIEWSWTDADVVQREVTASQEVEGPSGQKITVPMICSGQYLDATVFWAGGWFWYENNEISAVNWDFPSSLMACGTHPITGSPEECNVSRDGNSDSIPWRAMEPLATSVGGWDLTDTTLYSYPNVAWAGDIFRHKKLVFSPEKPSIGGSGQKRFSSIWQSHSAFSGQNTLVRFSHPSKSKIQQEEYQLLPLERSASPLITSESTMIQAVQCRPYHPEDMLCRESTRTAPELIRDMPTFAVTPTGRPEMPGVLLRKAPSDCTAAMFVQPLAGPALSPGVIKPVQVSTAFSGLVFDGSVPRVMGKMKTLKKTALPDEVPVLWWFFPDQEPVGFVETEKNWQMVSWSQIQPTPWQPLGSVVSILALTDGFWIAATPFESADHLLLYNPTWTEQEERAIRVPRTDELGTKTLWMTDSPRRLVFLGGQGDSLPFYDFASGSMQALALSESLDLGVRPLIAAAEDSTSIWVITVSKQMVVLNLLTGEVSLRGQLNESYDLTQAMLLPQGQDAAVVSVEEESSDADNTFIQFFEGEKATIHASTVSPALALDDPLNPGTWISDTPDLPERPATDSGCGCVVSRNSTNFGWFFPTLLFAFIVLRRFRKPTKQKRAFFFLIFLVISCDDAPRTSPDADIDGDVEDVLDADIDVHDADVVEDVPEYPGCTPWFGQEPVPASALTRFQVPGVRKGLIKLNFHGDYKDKVIFQFSINEVAPGYESLPSGTAWVWNLQTLDATSISEGKYIWEPSLFGDHVISTGKVIADETTHVFHYQFASTEWIAVTQYSYPELYFWSPSAGPQFAWISRHYEPDANTLECRLIQLDYATGQLTPIFEEEFTRCSDAFEVSDQVQAFCGTTATGHGLHVLYEGAHQVHPPEEFDGYSCAWPTIQGDTVLLKGRKWRQATVSGQLVDYLHYQAFVLHVPSGTITSVDPDLFWDTSGHSIHWPLVVYRNYKVGCSGSTDAVDLFAYLMIKNMETGVARPIPFPAPISSSEGLYELLAVEIMPNPWRLLLSNKGNPQDVPDINGELILIDLEEAGYVEPDGTVIPDPTFPPVPGT